MKLLIEKLHPSFKQLFADDDNENLLTKVLLKVLVFAVFAAILLLLIDLWLILKADKLDAIGVFGDFFGGVLNPIFTFLTLFGLIVTIVIQRQELGLARIEYEKTADALGMQAVETTFFNILDLHHNIVENLKVDISELKGGSALVNITEEIISGFIKISHERVFLGRRAFEETLNFITYKTDSCNEMVERYKLIQDKHNHVLGHYFRNLYQALKIIDAYNENILSKEQKRKYASILRAQLSTKELALLFINCLEGVSDKGQFKNLIIKYSMLEHLPIAKENTGFLLAGSIVANNEMVSQYKDIKDLKVELGKFYGGAFGKNSGIPYDLKPDNLANLE